MTKFVRFATAGNGADLRIGDTPTFSLVNTVLASSDSNYAAVKNNSADWAVNFANSFVQGFDVGDFADKANAYFYGVVTGGDPCFMNHVETGDNGASALRLRSNCPAKARPVWLVGTTAYIYDDVAQPAKPWRKVIDRGSYAASVTGLSLDSPLIPDAFGAERRKSNNACGPLCAHTGSTIFVLR